MKKMLCFLMLIISITGATFAQDRTTISDRTFDLPDRFAARRFTVDLGKGNKMQVDVDNMDDLNRLSNIDSVIRVFLTDMQPLQDSVGDELVSKRIDYATDSMGRKKIRIQQFMPKGSTFILTHGEVASLKLEQDTIHFIGTVSFIAKYSLRKAFPAIRHYRLSFFLNDLADLKTYMDGSLRKKIQTIQNDNSSAWITTRTPGKAYLKADPSISARLPKGLTGGGDFLNFRISVDLQNYKNYFVPAFSLGAGLIISNTYFKRDIILSWDPHFLFATNNQGRLQVFRNDFLALTWGQGFIRDNQPTKESSFLFVMSLAYLIKRDGNYFEKNTFRMGGGRLSLFEGKTKIEPVMYFHNFFKGVTPGLRWIQSF